jgi:hypothetical protein
MTQEYPPRHNIPSSSFSFDLLSKTFNRDYSIEEQDGKFVVFSPSYDQNQKKVGTKTRMFTNLAEAQNHYLETRRKRSVEQSPVLEATFGSTKLNFVALENYDGHYSLSSEALPVSNESREVLAFSGKNDHPDTEIAGTYYKTLETPNWQAHLFSFIETFSQTPEGQKLLNKLQITDLRLLIPQQAIRLCLEIVTRLKKYKTAELDVSNGQSNSDSQSVIQLLQAGLENRNNLDYEGNGICRNFASAVKALFEALKANQQELNFLNNTYCLFEAGHPEQYDPEFKSQLSSYQTTIPSPRSGHAWNSFVTISESGISQTVVDATWSNFDYASEETLKADYTASRMEATVFKNCQEKEVSVSEVISCYAQILRNLSTEKTVMDEELKARLRATRFYQGVYKQLETTYPGRETSWYEAVTFATYEQLRNEQLASTKGEFYISRLITLLNGRENELSPQEKRQLTDLISAYKKYPAYGELQFVANIAPNKADCDTLVTAFIQEWEAISATSYLPASDLVFRDRYLQALSYRAASPETRSKMKSEDEKHRRETFFYFEEPQTANRVWYTLWTAWYNNHKRTDANSTTNEKLISDLQVSLDILEDVISRVRTGKQSNQPRRLFGDTPSLPARYLAREVADALQPLVAEWEDLSFDQPEAEITVNGKAYKAKDVAKRASDLETRLLNEASR